MKNHVDIYNKTFVNLNIKKLGNKKDMLFYPLIPEEKMVRIKDKFGLDADEFIYIIRDTGTFNRGVKGTVVTDRGVYIKFRRKEPALVLPWHDIKRAIYNPDVKIMTLIVSKDGEDQNINLPIRQLIKKKRRFKAFGSVLFVHLFSVFIKTAEVLSRGYDFEAVVKAVIPIEYRTLYPHFWQKRDWKALGQGQKVMEDLQVNSDVLITGTETLKFTSPKHPDNALSQVTHR